MKILIVHSSGFDFQNELYEPLRNSAIAREHELYFPHDPEHIDLPTREELKRTDLVIGEVSYPSTGEGIEIGLAVAMDVPLLLLHKEGTKPSSSLRFVVPSVHTYRDTEDMLNIIAEYLRYA